MIPCRGGSWYHSPDSQPAGSRAWPKTALPPGARGPLSGGRILLLKLSPSFKKCEARVRGKRDKRQGRLRHSHSSSACLGSWGLIQSGFGRPSWKSLPRWPVLPSALLCCLELPFLNAEQGPCSSSSQLRTYLWPLIPHHLRDPRARLARSPPRQTRAQAQFLDLPGLYQAVASREQGTDPRGVGDRRLLLPAALFPVREPCPPTSPAPSSSSDTGTSEPHLLQLRVHPPLPHTLRDTDTAHHKDPEFTWVLYFFLIRCTLSFFFK